MIAQLEPFFDLLRQVLGCIRLEIKSAIAGYFMEYRDIADKEREVVLGRLHKRQSETLAERGRDQAGAGGIDLFQILVADAIQPKEMPAPFRVPGYAAHGLGDISAHGIGQGLPSFLADNDQIDVNALIPQEGKRLERLQVAFAGLDGPDHQETWLGPQLCKDMRRGGRQGAAWRGMGDIRAVMRPADAERFRCVRPLDIGGAPQGQRIGHIPGNTDGAVESADCLQPVRIVLIGSGGNTSGMVTDSRSWTMK